MFKGRSLSDQSFQLDALDGLRGLAVLLVVGSHLSNHGIMFAPSFDMSGTGKSGVFLFFVLSSFLLTYPFIAKGAAACDRAYLANYAFRRFMRIYPLYFAYLGIGFVSTWLSSAITHGQRIVGIPFALSGDEFLGHLLLQQGKGVTWSIAVEFHYYFLLPLVAYLFSLVVRRRVLPTLLITAALIGVGQLIWPPDDSSVNDIRLGPYLPVFFIGSSVAVIHFNLKTVDRSVTKAIRLLIELAGWASILVLILLAPSVSARLFEGALPNAQLHKQYLLFALLWSAVLLGCIDGIGVLRRCFEWKFLRYLGFISFSVYLLHVVIPGVATRLVVSPILRAWITLAMTIAVSHLSWMLIERPMSRLRLSAAPLAKSSADLK